MLNVSLNAIARHIYFQAFYILGIIGLFTYGVGVRYIPVEPQTIFELVILALSAFGISRFEPLKNGILFLLVFLYILSSYLLVLARGEVGFYDFLMAYKSYIYILLAFFFVDYKFIHKKNLIPLFRFLMVVFFFKYIISVVFGFDYRPIVYRENNYELMFFALFFYFYALYVERPTLLVICLMTLVFFISGSRSAIALYAVVLLAINLEGMKIRKMLSLILCAVVMFILLYFVFISRLGDDGLGSIDRLWFFGFFQDETYKWGFFDYLFGAERITRMSDYTCHALRFYENLVSFHDPYTCYSVILHSFVMRSIFDHGLVFSFILILSVYSILRKAGHKFIPAFIFVFVVFLNGFSVSSFNSVFYMLALVIFVCVPMEEIEKRSNKSQ